MNPTNFDSRTDAQPAQGAGLSGGAGVRSFVPRDADLGEWSHVEPLLKQLVLRPIESARQAVQWIHDLSELAAWVTEEGVMRHIQASRDTMDAERQGRLIDFIEQINSRCLPYWAKLNRRVIEDPYVQELPTERYGYLRQQAPSSLQSFLEKSSDDYAEHERLVRDSMACMSIATTTFRGGSYSLAEMNAFLQSPAAAVREEAWKVIAQRRARDVAALESLFDRLVEIRHRAARAAGHRDFCEQQLYQSAQLDELPIDLPPFCDALAEIARPLVSRIDTRARTRLGLEALRPWDLPASLYAGSREPPYTSPNDLVEGISRILGRIEPQLLECFQNLVRNDLVDLEPRQAKEPVEFTAQLPASRQQYIFLNATGGHGDLVKLLQQIGFAYHARLMAEEPIYSYRFPPSAFVQVAGSVVHLLGCQQYDQLYSQRQAAIYHRRDLEDLILMLPRAALTLAFQHRVYTQPDLSPAERHRAWLELAERFDTRCDWSGFETERATEWLWDYHIFRIPFEQINFAIGTLGGLQIWLRHRNDPDRVLTDFKNALALGGSKPLPDLFQAAGIPFDFSREALEPLAQDVAEAIETLQQSIDARL